MYANKKTPINDYIKEKSFHSKENLASFSGSDWTNSRSGCSSTTEFVMGSLNCFVKWNFTKQPVIALSPTEENMKI